MTWYKTEELLPVEGVDVLIYRYDSWTGPDEFSIKFLFEGKWDPGRYGIEGTCWTNLPDPPMGPQ